ncbi:putative Cyclic nucleotide-binding protein [Syntrophobacter sp. SbD1]|nr:putative Cyclic nucleotide-binding protein [Syntrophobacter sp. SbD1]
MIAVEDLLCIGIFKDFPPEVLAGIIPSLSEKSFNAGTCILYRGDPGYSMFMILSGSVAVTLINDDGIEYTLTTLGKGEVFGEMALLTGEPRSANVKAATDVVLAELSQEAFLELIATFPNLNESLLRLLVQRRTRSSVRQQFAHIEREEIIASLFAQLAPDVDHFLGNSKAATDTNAAIARLAAAEGNVLILGERGTGKELAARLIHVHGPSGTRPLYHLDCADPPPITRDEERRKGREKDELHLEIAQEAGLFGHGADAGSYARSIRRGYMELADGGSIVLENVDCLAPRVQRLLVEYCRDGTFLPRGGSHQISSRVRLITTASRTLVELKEEGKLDPEMLALVSEEVLYLKPLRQRKKDIPVIAQHFLDVYNKKFTKQISHFSKEALNLLVDHDWLLNVDELRQVVERAVVITEGNAITEGQVFLKLPSFSTTGRFNLLGIPFLRELLNKPLIPSGLLFITVPFIILVIVCTIFGPGENNLANLVVWSIWEPLLIISIFFVGRSWCAYCPLPLIGEYAGRFRKKFLPLPGVLVRYDFWIAVGGLIIIIQAEHIFDMFNKAHGTGILLLVILSGAVITSFLFGRRSWCKHFCPLGRMIAQYATISLIELGSNNNVCSSQCQNHDCVRHGNCPMGIHPSTASLGKDCIFCLSCVKICQHRSARLNARFPWQDLLRKEKWEPSDALFAVLVIASVLAVKLPDWGIFRRFILRESARSHGLIAALGENLSITIVFAALVLLASGFPFKREWKRHFVVAGYAYLFLALSGLLNIYLHEFVYNGHQLLPWGVHLFSSGTLELPDWLTPNLGTLKALFPIITLAGGISSFLMLKMLADKYCFTKSSYRIHQVILILVMLLFLLIL